MKLNLSGTTLIQQLILQIVTGLIVAANPGIVKAQLTPDNTVGSTTRSDTVKGLNSDIIEGGATRGTNLFHSFTNFNVDAGRGVYFSNPADINNILTRVTGSSQSNIFGTLGVLGNANLFLINPNGISFGPNAQLDVKGSFVASTADRIIFDNYQFTTTNPTAPPLLTVNIPVGLGFRNNPGDINVNLAGSTLAFNNGQGLKVPEGKTLALIGGNVNINGNGVNAEGLRAGILSPGSQIQLGGLTQTGTVNFNENFSSTFPQGVTRGNVSLSNGAEINVRAAGGGSITINSRNLNVNGNSRVRGGIQKNLGSANAQAGNIEINNIEQVTLDNNGVISNVIDEFGKGNAGDINIHSSSLTLKNDSAINTSVFAASSEGNGGNVTINTSTLTVENGGYISADTNGIGNAGNVAIKATQGVTIGGLLTSEVTDTGEGNSGGITIDTSTLTLENDGIISASTFGKGNAGNIAIKATQGINVRGWLSSSSDVKGTAQGNSGGITIDTSTLTLENGGYISADTYGKGNAGNVAIKATQGVTVGGFLTSEVTDTGEGNSGGITIDTSTLTLENDGIISASTFGKGNAGAIDITANDITIDQSRVGNVVGETATGMGNNITITTSNLTLKNGGEINTSTFGQGSAGYIKINARDSINISGYAKDENNKPIFYRSFPLRDDQGNVIYDNQGNVIYSENKLASSRIESEVKTFARGNGGYIDINTSNLNLKDGGVISTSTYGQGSAGDIDINAKDKINISGYAKDENNESIFDPSFPLIDDKGNVIYYGNKLASSRIESNVESGAEGNAGNIKIDLNAGSLSLTDGGLINASTFGKGDAGAIDITANDITIDQSRVGNVVGETATGIGNNITITTSNLTLKNDSAINTSVFAASSEGNGGNVTINTSTLTVENGGYISADTNGIGNAGNVAIKATQGVTIGGLLTSEVTDTGEGNSGGITIDTSTLTLENDGIISASTFGKGNAGNIAIKATEGVTVRGYLNSQVTNTAQGNSGGITIDTSTL
ncbi:MAG: filamentous hemagglutinin N-terminal domain-containing protein, partial [Aphanizomenon gracile PMC644.10]|nr:filamentous hemagglutinin N-terminal domain-containing protein [Aphanizomenon gracile PMC644.10]